MKNELILKAEAIMKNSTDATIAKIDDNGYPRASTISNIKTDGIKTVWFSTGLSSHKVKFFKLNNKASVCYCDGENNITLIGTIEILSDPELKKQLWADWFINHFPGGVTDPNYCILKFTTNSAFFWIDNQYEEIELKVE
ncbi:pyridoxamine 5'-phosphate oxidase family protein [Sedimentibacter sp.]|uniref:pyridoxamine 5'-phosphate oxidase family protein n=1 Tax=Sedimentibacter sp. TaxID=1960295 RepID=UPI0028A61C1D|nr:pyridoxamine 5'-phosphate oxidase family protein [Sedimentibacter sp.]